MSKATKNFIAGALVATLPLFVASLMKDDPQVVQGANPVVLDSAQALAAELGLSHSAGILAPLISLHAALQMPKVDAENVRLETTTAVFGSEMHLSETFTVDIHVHKKPLTVTHIYSNRCTFSGGELVNSEVVARPISSMNWVDGDPNFIHSAATAFRDSHSAQCKRLERNGVFEQVRQGMTEAGSDAGSTI